PSITRLPPSFPSSRPVDAVILPRTLSPPDPPLPSFHSGGVAPHLHTGRGDPFHSHSHQPYPQSKDTTESRDTPGSTEQRRGEALRRRRANSGGSGQGERRLDESGSDGRDLGGSESGEWGYGGSSGRGRQIRRTVPQRFRWVRLPDPAGIWSAPPAPTGPRLSTPKGRASSCRGHGHNTSAFPPLPMPKFTAGHARTAPPTAAHPTTAVSMPTVVTAAAAIPR
ncbi:unnamed protein product, partial [Urochloa humidicola]